MPDSDIVIDLPKKRPEVVGRFLSMVASKMDSLLSPIEVVEINARVFARESTMTPAARLGWTPTAPASISGHFV